MRELQAQSLVVKAVREHGGVAFKMANRFLVGVSDLFVQLPGCPSALWEVKLNKMKWGSKDTIVLDLTTMQENFLRDLIKAGGKGGVISFVQDAHDLYFTVQPGPMRNFYEHFYTKLDRGRREQKIVECLYAVSRHNWRDM